MKLARNKDMLGVIAVWALFSIFAVAYFAGFVTESIARTEMARRSNMRREIGPAEDSTQPRQGWN